MSIIYINKTGGKRTIFKKQEMTEIIKAVDKDNKTLINIFQILEKVEESSTSLLKRAIDF